MKRAAFFLLWLITIASCKKDETKLAATSTIVYQDSLIVDKQTWISDSTAYHVRKFYQGHYSIREDSANSIIVSFAPYATINFPYSVQVDGTIQLKDPGKLGSIGVIFNYIDSSSYSVLQIISNGLYIIGEMRNGTFSTIVQPTSSTAIHAGSGVSNRIIITQNAINMDLQINGIAIGSFPSVFTGSLSQVGLFTATTPNSSIYYFTPVTGLFNNFILTKI